jgi:outer membrane biosynthesis protein TonB
MARLIVRREARSEDGVTEAVVGSLGMHAVLIAAVFWGASHISIPAPPQIYQVELVAAPRQAPVRAVPVPDRPKPAPEEKPRARPVETKPAPSERPRKETRPAEVEKEAVVVAPESRVEEKPAAAPEQSREGVEGLPVRLEGAPFPYPEYLANVILQIKRHWRPPTGGQQLRAELAFTITREGSVEDVAWVRRSGNPAFDLEARGAIEAAGRRRAFGSLPEGYPSDFLRVSFFFDPTRY